MDNPYPRGLHSANESRSSAANDYILAQHVPILDEHPMPASGDEPATYCGPKELQEIANNNNRRIQETGDACPIVIGHTEDGEPETEQPEIVGYATNFRVGPLFNTGRLAVFADFHIEKDKKDLVNKYPRRSVELWPKRWEVDPISLLGATTPERDLGLLRLARQHKVVKGGNSLIRYNRRREVVRYSRILEGDFIGPLFNRKNVKRYSAEEAERCKCGCDASDCVCKGKCKQPAVLRVHRADIEDREGTPMCQICAEDALESGMFKAGKLFSHQPKVKKSRNYSGGSMPNFTYPTPYPTRRRYAKAADSDPETDAGMGGYEPADEGEAKIVQAVLQSAPLQKVIQGQAKQEELLQEIMQLLQSQGEQGEEMQQGPEGEEPDGSQSAGQQEARWMHESHENPEEEEGAPTQYAMHEEDEHPDQYAMDCEPMKRKMSAEHTMESDEDDESDDAHPGRYSAYASSTNDYIPNEGSMTKPRKRSYSRKSHYEQYLDSLRENEVVSRFSRVEQQNKQQQAVINELVRDKIRYSRAAQLAALQQSEGISMDVGEEVDRTISMDDKQFAAEVERIKKRYSRDPSGFAPIRTADPTVVAGLGHGAARSDQPQRYMNHDQKLRYSRAVADEAMAIKKKSPDLSDADLMEKAKANVDKRFVA